MRIKIAQAGITDSTPGNALGQYPSFQTESFSNDGKFLRSILLSQIGREKQAGVLPTGAEKKHVHRFNFI